MPNRSSTALISRLRTEAFALKFETGDLRPDPPHSLRIVAPPVCQPAGRHGVTQPQPPEPAMTMSSPLPEDAKAELDPIIGELSRLGFALLGTITRHTTSRGKPSWRCQAETDPRLHGPDIQGPREVKAKTVEGRGARSQSKGAHVSSGLPDAVDAPGKVREFTDAIRTFIDAWNQATRSPYLGHDRRREPRSRQRES